MLRALPRGRVLPTDEAVAWAGDEPNPWAGDEPNPGIAPLLVNTRNAFKQLAATRVLAWYRDQASVTFAPRRVYFFDDLAENVEAFAGTGYNARQVSCSTRQGVGSPPRTYEIGYCGGTPDEVCTSYLHTYYLHIYFILSSHRLTSP